jgi:hypothetical protein
MRRLALLCWLACVAPALPAAAHEPLAGASGVAVPVRAPGGQRVEVWLPFGALAGETHAHGCGCAVEPAPEAARAAAEPRGRRWHAGDACGPISRYRVVERTGGAASDTE